MFFAYVLLIPNLNAFYFIISIWFCVSEMNERLNTASAVLTNYRNKCKFNTFQFCCCCCSCCIIPRNCLKCVCFSSVGSVQSAIKFGIWDLSYTLQIHTFIWQKSYAKNITGCRLHTLTVSVYICFHDGQFCLNRLFMRLAQINRHTA